MGKRLVLNAVCALLIFLQPILMLAWVPQIERHELDSYKGIAILRVSSLLFSWVGILLSILLMFLANFLWKPNQVKKGILIYLITVGVSSVIGLLISILFLIGMCFMSLWAASIMTSESLEDLFTVCYYIEAMGLGVLASLPCLPTWGICWLIIKERAKKEAETEESWRGGAYIQFP